MRRYRDWSLGWKVVAPIVVVVAAVLAALLVVATRMSTAALDRAYDESMSARVSQLVATTELYERELTVSCERLGSLFAGLQRAPLRLDPGRPVEVKGTMTPSLLDGEVPLNGRTERVDTFTRDSHAVATIFARAGDDFVRISTSLTNAEGERALGTKLAKDHPAYAGLLDGRPYTGRATLFGREYMTSYLPSRDASGAVIGSWFVGLDFTDGLAALESSFASQKVGETGYVYVVDASTGKRRGEALIHPTLVGKSLLDLRDPVTGDAYVATMLDRGRGELRHAVDVNGASARWLTVFAPYERWHWLVAATVPEGEVQAAGARLRDWILILAAAALLVIAGSIVVLVHSMVGRTLEAAVQAAEEIAAGDLTVRVESTCQDEAGRLLAALVRMTARLAEMIGAIERTSRAVGVASRRIASGSSELSERTESQATSLAATAATLERLTVAVRHNVDHASEADQLAADSSVVAKHAGEVVRDVVATMRTIQGSSARIAEITGVLDDLAFQTNILALNAAVEAARAGDDGRSFAVVAAEVRRLALQSDDSAKAIKRLIVESTREVEVGAHRVDEAGRTIDEMVTKVALLSDHMTSIAAASREQGRGMEQMNEAVAEMDRGTRRTSELAEASAEAAARLEEQARRLGQELSVFTLSDGSERRPTRRSRADAALTPQPAGGAAERLTRPPTVPDRIEPPAPTSVAA